MNQEIENYNAQLSVEEQAVCITLMNEINRILSKATSKIWHGSPVWFLNDNPIVGYSKLKNGIQLLFWSGQSFDEDGLKPVGKYQASEARYVTVGEINIDLLTRWLTKSEEIQWDYKNIAKRKGELLRIEDLL